MSGRLKRIDVLLNQEDYVMILATLNENLGECVEDGAPTQAIAKTDKKPLTEEPSRTTTCEYHVFAREFFYGNLPY